MPFPVIKQYTHTQVMGEWGAGMVSFSASSTDQIYPRQMHAQGKQEGIFPPEKRSPRPAIE